jgi:hypothetical protein
MFAVFWDVTPWNLIGTCSFCLQGTVSAEANKKSRKGGRRFFIHHFFSVLNFAFNIEEAGSSKIATHLPIYTTPYLGENLQSPYKAAIYAAAGIAKCRTARQLARWSSLLSSGMSYVHHLHVYVSVGGAVIKEPRARKH